jgi:hypothetical protein
MRITRIYGNLTLNSWPKFGHAFEPELSIAISATSIYWYELRVLSHAFKIETPVIGLSEFDVKTLPFAFGSFFVPFLGFCWQVRVVLPNAIAEDNTIGPVPRLRG